MSFKKSLTIGALGETLYFQAHNGKLERLDGLKADFRCMETGDLYELKTDTYSMDSTPNMFIERYSDNIKRNPGGPFQSKVNGCKYFTYFYVQNLTLFTFLTQSLIDRIEQLAPQLRVMFIQNKSWVTEGYLVPRTLIEDLAKIETLEIKLK